MAHIEKNNLKKQPRQATPSTTSKPQQQQQQQQQKQPEPQKKKESKTVKIITENDTETQFKDLPVSTMRSVIAKRLTESKTTIPHFYLTADCDISDLIALRKSLLSVSSSKFSLNDMIISACALSLQSVPLANVHWDSKLQSVVQNASCDISVAGIFFDFLNFYFYFFITFNFFNFLIF